MKFTKFINLTPHDVHIMDDNGEIHTFLSQGVARREEYRTEFSLKTPFGSFPVSFVSYGQKVIGLPDPQPGVAYIVSARVLTAVPGRVDVFCPGPGIRDEVTGEIIAHKGLSCTQAFVLAKSVEKQKNLVDLLLDFAGDLPEPEIESESEFSIGPATFKWTDENWGTSKYYLSGNRWQFRLDFDAPLKERQELEAFLTNVLGEVTG